MFIVSLFNLETMHLSLVLAVFRLLILDNEYNPRYRKDGHLISKVSKRFCLANGVKCVNEQVLSVIGA